MANLSQIKREKMLKFLETLKEQHSDDESLIAINQIENELTSKKYGLVWEEHEEEVDVKMRTHIPVFTEVEAKEIVGASESEQYNFLLEGDNLHSLKLLEKTHKGMDLFNPHDSLLGKTINFFVDVYGEEPKRAKVLFQTMTDTIEMKACYEQRCINYDEVILKKGISRNELQKILEKHIDISDESIQIVKQEIKEIYPEFSVCTKMNAALVAVTKELRTNKVLIKIEQSIVKYILGNLELFDGEIVDSILLLDNVYKKEFPVEYTFQERHSLYIMVIVRVREGYYA